MPDKPKGDKKGGGKLLGLGTGTWIGIGAGGLGIIWYLRRRDAASQAAAATGTTGGTTIPAADGASSTAIAAPTTLAEWINQALPQVVQTGYTSTQALNDINDWLGGQCVSSAGYSALGQLVSSLGVPPGYTTLPPITVCAGSSTPGTTISTATGPGGGAIGGGSTEQIAGDPAVTAAEAYLSSSGPAVTQFENLQNTENVNQDPNEAPVQAAQATAQNTLLYSSAMSELGLTGAYANLTPAQQDLVQRQAAA